jgi:hypothetical protein
LHVGEAGGMADVVEGGDHENADTKQNEYTREGERSQAS